MHFNVDGSDYLVYVGQGDAVVYWWSGDGFLNYQTLANSNNARDVDALKLYDGEILLSLLFDDHIKVLAHFTTLITNCCAACSSSRQMRRGTSSSRSRSRSCHKNCTARRCRQCS